MSLHLEFEPHSWYKGWAIQKIEVPYEFDATRIAGNIWNAYTDNGNAYRVDTETALTLKELKQLINNRINQLNERDAYNRARLGE